MVYDSDMYDHLLGFDVNNILSRLYKNCKVKTKAREKLSSTRDITLVSDYLYDCEFIS